ncbi:arabinose transporter [Rhodopila sp.]|uniref:arabinose transporter n=1 Tax=Rhodopila sp. TaxID=2480087 RepID=UPI003D09BE4A
MNADAGRIRSAPDEGCASVSATVSSAPAGASVVIALLPIMAAVSIAFLIIGIALPVLPLHVHQDLGLSTFTVGLVAGSQFVASLMSRVWAGNYADSRGAKRAVVAGLLTAVVGGLLYLTSLQFLDLPRLSVTILLLGRAVLGMAESLIITGAVSWGLTLLAPANAGRVIAWIGMAMFAALAVGAPIGSALYQAGGFKAIAIVTALVPFAAILFVAPLACSPPQRGKRPALLKVAALVWMPGFGSALSSIGFGVMIAFSSLLSIERQWHPIWLLFSIFSGSLVIARLLLGQIPDKFGGARVALVSVVIEAGGLALIWLVPGQTMGAVGAILTGFGFALVYPGLGVEAVRRTPPQSRGLAMGAYTAFLDVALGLGSPALGLIAGWAGLDSVFLAAALIVLGAAFIAIRLLHETPSGIAG